jgi:hypothetical protein
VRRASDPSGSTLIEALIATLILTTALTVMAQLVSVAAADNLLARQSTIARVLAEQKHEQLMAQLALGGAGASSPWSLQADTPGFVDYVDERGIVVGSGPQAVPLAVYTRRWAIESLPSPASGQTFLIQVLVTLRRSRGVADRGTVDRLPGEARLVSVWRAP